MGKLMHISVNIPIEWREYILKRLQETNKYTNELELLESLKGKGYSNEDYFDDLSYEFSWEECLSIEVTSADENYNISDDYLFLYLLKEWKVPYVISYRETLYNNGTDLDELCFFEYAYYNTKRTYTIRRLFFNNYQLKQIPFMSLKKATTLVKEQQKVYQRTEKLYKQVFNRLNSKTIPVTAEMYWLTIGEPC